jgi:hypothetical protein
MCIYIYTHIYICVCVCAFIGANIKYGTSNIILHKQYYDRFRFLQLYLFKQVQVTE